MKANGSVVRWREEGLHLLVYPGFSCSGFNARALLLVFQDLWLSEAKSRLEEADNQRERLTMEVFSLRQEARRNQVRF